VLYLREENNQVLSPYAALPPLEINGKEVVVAEGTGAIRAYEAMLYGHERHDPAIRSAWKSLLLQYCKLDTLAMVISVLDGNRRESAHFGTRVPLPYRPTAHSVW